jgi:hypothetical protein
LNAASHDDSCGCFDDCCFTHDEDCCGCGTGCGGSCNNKRGTITSHTETQGDSVGNIPAEEIQSKSHCTKNSIEEHTLESAENN